MVLHSTSYLSDSLRLARQKEMILSLNMIYFFTFFYYFFLFLTSSSIKIILFSFFSIYTIISLFYRLFSIVITLQIPQQGFSLFFRFFLNRFLIQPMIFYIRLSYCPFSTFYINALILILFNSSIDSLSLSFDSVDLSYEQAFNYLSVFGTSTSYSYFSEFYYYYYLFPEDRIVLST